MEWARDLALKLSSRSQDHVIATGVSPSGPLHIGNLREILIADQLSRELLKLGVRSQILYFIDDLDPLRRRYSFIPKEYSDYVGMPISRIPDPQGCCSSYADHFLNPFLESLQQLGIECKLLRAHQLYSRGDYSRAILRSLQKWDVIRKIISEVASADLPESWSPFMPLCSKCFRLTTTQVTQFDSKGIRYRCQCGNSGEASYAGGGKLRWRVDWPARWWIFNVTAEPFGKDLAVAGGAYSTGAKISSQVFNYPPPFPIPFEHILLKGKGKLSSSRGIAVTPSQLLELMPPSLLRKLILEKKPSRHIDFDLDCIPEQIQRLDDFQVPFLHLILVVQLARDVEHALQILSRAGYTISSQDQLQQLSLRMEYARRILEDPRYSRLRIQILKDPRCIIPQLSEDQIRGLKMLSQLIPGSDPIQIHNLIYQVAREIGIDPPELFKAIYLIFLGRESGPRAGWFLSSLDPEFLRDRLSLES